MEARSIQEGVARGRRAGLNATSEQLEGVKDVPDRLPRHHSGAGAGVTLGIDLASQPNKTAACRIRWARPVVVEDPIVGLTDPDLVNLISQADKVGIDVPLGWPVAFAENLFAHQARSAWTLGHTDPRLYLRATDRFVVSEIRRRPLSVSADKIAVPAMRAAHLLSQLDRHLDRTGSGIIVEVYPAASLSIWGFDANRYKGRDGTETRRRLLESFRKATESWVVLNETCYAACIADDNAFDALIASLTARAAAVGLCRPVPPDDVPAAAVEGWIALPTDGSLEMLA
jgi:uncharacterized protein DUF429